MADPTLHKLITASVTINVDVVIVIGDLIGWDATNGRWTKADTDTATLYAQWIAVSNSVSSGFYHSVSASKEAVIEDLDAPFTAAGKIYLSSTAGAWTQTRPTVTTTSRIVQTVGYALDTFKGYFKLPAMLSEMAVYQPFTQWTASVGFGATVLDSGNYGSEALNADNDEAFLQFAIPEKAVSLAAAYLYYAEEAEVGTIALLMQVSSAISATQWDAVTADATITAFDIAANTVADDINKLDIGPGGSNNMFDATNIFKPGALLGVRAHVDLSGTDVVHLYGIEFYWNVVD